MDLCGEFREAGGKVAISLAVFRSEIAANVEAGIQFPKRKTKTITDGVFFGVLREEKSGDIEKFILTLESNRRSLAKLFPDPAWENVILHCVSMDDHVLNLPAQIAIPKQPTKSQQKAIFGNLSTEDGRKKYKKAIREIEHPAIEPVIHLNVLKFVGQVVDDLIEEKKPGTPAKRGRKRKPLSVEEKTIDHLLEGGRFNRKPEELAREAKAFDEHGEPDVLLVQQRQAARRQKKRRS